MVFFYISIYTTVKTLILHFLKNFGYDDDRIEFPETKTFKLTHKDKDSDRSPRLITIFGLIVNHNVMLLTSF